MPRSEEHIRELERRYGFDAHGSPLRKARTLAACRENDAAAFRKLSAEYGEVDALRRGLDLH